MNIPIKIANKLGLTVVRTRPRSYPYEEFVQSLIDESKKLGISDVNEYRDMINDYEAANAVSEIFHHIETPFGRILEVGAGTGRFTRELVKYVPKNTSITSLEYSKPVYEFLRQYVEEKQFQNVTAELADYYNNNFENEVFDIVLIPWFDMTQSLFKWSLTIEEASRILKKKGLLIFDFMDSKDEDIDYLTKPSNAIYFFVNGDDLDRITDHFGHRKLYEFVNNYEAKRRTTYRIYQKTV